MQSRKGWSEIEDDRLTKIIKKYGMKNWTLISEKLSLGGTQERTGKQCRERWHNNLNPAITNQTWTPRDDAILFDAHRRYGSKWKQISKLFEGRTDNSIKNHFYSTVRCCLRRLGKMKGERHTAASMKSIKPYVLSKIVENAELTNLILSLGRDKSRNVESVDLDEATVNHINSELQRISIQYEQKINKSGEHRLSSNEGSCKSIDSLSGQCKMEEDPAEEIKLVVKKLSPQDEALRCYFEEQEEKEQAEELVLETQQESKERHEPSQQFSFRCFEAQGQAKEVLETAQKYQKQVQRNDEIWIEQQESHNFFNSPACSKKNKFPFLKLLSKISRNSQSQVGQGVEERAGLGPRGIWAREQQEQQMQIDYDPRDLLNSSFENEREKQGQ